MSGKTDKPTGEELEAILARPRPQHPTRVVRPSGAPIPIVGGIVSDPGTLRDAIASALEEAYDLWRMANTNEPYPEMFAPLADAVLVVVKAHVAATRDQRAEAMRIPLDAFGPCPAARAREMVSERLDASDALLLGEET